jgi:hypothetical protein
MMPLASDRSDAATARLSICVLLFACLMQKIAANSEKKKNTA